MSCWCLQYKIYINIKSINNINNKKSGICKGDRISDRNKQQR